MSASLLEGSLVISQVALALAMACATWRVLRGPRAQDRVLAFDALYVNGMLLLVLFGLRTGSSLYYEAALVMGLFGFVGTVALAKFVMRGEVIE